MDQLRNLIVFARVVDSDPARGRRSALHYAAVGVFDMPFVGSRPRKSPQHQGILERKAVAHEAAPRDCRHSA